MLYKTFVLGILIVIFNSACKKTKPAISTPVHSTRECLLIHYPMELDSCFIGLEILESEYLNFINSTNELDLLSINVKSGGYRPTFKRIICDSQGNWYVSGHDISLPKLISPSSILSSLLDEKIDSTCYYNAYCKNQSATPSYVQYYFFKNSNSGDKYVQILFPNSTVYDVLPEEKDKIKFSIIMEQYIKNIEFK